jgi:hypothetical protein
MDMLISSGPGTLEGLFNNVREILQNAGIAALTVAIILVGFKVMFALRRGDNIREAIQNLGVIVIAALLIAGAGGIAFLLGQLGERIGSP